MKKITFYSLESIGIIEKNENLPQKIIDACERENLEIQNRDVIVITSKVVSMYENRIIDLGEIEVSKKAKTIAENTGIVEEEVELILQEGKILGALPISKIGKEHILQQAASKEKAKQALENIPSMLITERNNRICTNAGVDLSNSPENKATLLPENPDKSAKEIREIIEQKTNKDIAVIITDSEISIRGGSVDIAIGSSGIKPIKSKVGAEDLFGNPKVGGIDMKADEIAGAAALHFGQAAEKTPVVIGRGIEYKKGEKTQKNSQLMQKGIKHIFLSSIKIRTIKEIS